MQGQQPPAIPEDPVEFAQMMRRMMGWENSDVTGCAVAAEAREIEGSETKIPVRVYTPPAEGKRPASGRQGRRCRGRMAAISGGHIFLR